MPDLTPAASLAGSVTPEVSIGGKVTVPEIVYLQGLKGEPGEAGHTPVITAEKTGKVTTVMVDGVVVATISDGVVATVNSKTADGNGNVALTGEDIPMSASDDTTLSAKIAAKQSPTQNLDAETALADEDSFPFYDASASANKKTLWSNIVAKLKNLFLSLTGGTVTGRIQNTYASGSGIEITHADAGADCGLAINKASSSKSGAIFVGVGSSGKAGIYSSTLGKWIVSTDGTTTHVDNALPLTGGTVTGPIWVKKATEAYVRAINTTNNYSCTLYALNNTVGLYAGHLNKWIIKNNGTTTTVDNTIPATAGAVKTTNLADKAVTAAKLATDAVKLTFTNKSVAASAFVSNSTYADFPYRAAVALTGVTAAMVPEVFFGLTDAMSGNFAPVAESYAGGVYIYAAAKPSATTTIPTILCWR